MQNIDTTRRYGVRIDFIIYIYKSIFNAMLGITYLFTHNRPTPISNSCGICTHFKLIIL